MGAQKGGLYVASDKRKRPQSSGQISERSGEPIDIAQAWKLRVVNKLRFGEISQTAGMLEIYRSCSITALTRIDTRSSSNVGLRRGRSAFTDRRKGQAVAVLARRASH
jgi:hypothetical protein